jgi:hypothetical protein
MNWKLYEPEAGGFAPAKLQSNSKIPKKTISNNTVNKVFVPLKMICKDAAIEYGWGATFNPFYGFKRLPENDSYDTDMIIRVYGKYIENFNGTQGGNNLNDFYKESAKKDE